MITIREQAALLLAALWASASVALAAPKIVSRPAVRRTTIQSRVVPVKAMPKVLYPANAGVLNVREARFGACGDGQTDDTAAIQKALTEGLGTHRIVYVPDGVYVVSDTLRWQNAANAGNDVQGWGPFLQLQGQSRSGTVLKLRDNAVGYANVEAPKAVLQTGSSGSHGGKKYSNGEGNEAFENHIRDLTIDVGRGNGGAIGIDYQASNVGAMRGVSIRSSDPAKIGFCGVNLTRRDNGPGLLKDVSIDGFRFGIRTAQEIAHFTLEDITLSNQSEAGLWLRDSIVAARKITSRNRVPAIQSAGMSLLALFDCDFSGGQGGAAIVCSGEEARLYLRHLQTSGYAASIQRGGQEVKAARVAEWSSDVPLGAANGKLSLKLPIRDTPQWYDPDTRRWADAGAPSGADDTASVQAALNAGRSTVYFRYGTYRIHHTLTVPPSVKRLIGIGTSLDVPDALPNDGPLFRFIGGKTGDLTIIDRFTMGGKAARLFEHRDGRTLVLRDIMPFVDGGIYRNQVGAGPLFLEDISGAGYEFAPGTQVWARQWNLEGRGQPKAVNDGATLWAMGTKHESAETIFENKNGARTEIWSAFAYTFGAEKDRPAFLNTDASIALSLAGMTFMGPNGYFDLLVRDTQNGQTQELRRSSIPPRGGGAMLPLYVSASKSATSKPNRQK